MKIGVIGSGRIGSLVGRLWVEAGHEVRFSSRHPEQLEPFVRHLGARASLGSVEDAAAFGEVLLISVPYSALPELGRSLAATGSLDGKVVLETANPYVGRDGTLATEVTESGLGMGIWSARWLPGARLVRAFNSVWDQTLVKAAHRDGPRIGIPLASDDRDALSVAVQLVTDSGFDPVIVGPLAEARRFDVGTSVYNTGMTAAEIRQTLNLPERAVGGGR